MIRRRECRLELRSRRVARASSSPAWRQHSDRVNANLVERWLPAKISGRLLKTDLFDEVASEGIYSVLATRADKICGMGLVFHAAAVYRKYPEVAACAADIRSLPFANSSFGLVSYP
jgi:hypothetical protein